MSQTSTKENKMGTMPVNKLLVTMSLPMMISMLIQALYNIVDSIFVAQINVNALTAVTLAFPIQNLMIAIGVGTGVGINALLAKSLGEKNQDQANKSATNGLFLCIINYIIFLVFGMFFARWFFETQTDIQEIIDYGTTYLAICCVFSFGCCGQLVLEKLLQATGKTMLSMYCQLLGAIINIVLDPILIFGWFGLPKMGVAGAAIATVIGQIASCVFGIYLNYRHNHDITIRFKGFTPCVTTIKKIYNIGLPSIFMQAIGSIMTFGMNNILMSFSHLATTAFGIYFKLQSFVFMPILGISNGLVPIISYNYGAKRPDRMTKAMKLSYMYAIGLMLLGCVVIQLFPTELIKLFDSTEELLTIGVPALRTISLSFLFAGFCIISSSIFQALGKGIFSLLVSVIRQLVVLLPVAYLLSKTGQLELVWYSFPIAELASLALCIGFIAYTSKTIVKPLISKN